jgi:SsrA-binding protein
VYDRISRGFIDIGSGQLEFIGPARYKSRVGCARQQPIGGHSPPYIRWQGTVGWDKRSESHQQDAGRATRDYARLGLRREGEYAPVAKKKNVDKEHDNERVVSENRKAKHNYTVLDTLECGIMLVGSEVKSLRAGRVSLDESYGRLREGELWLIGCDIPEYVQANQFNHPPRRPRKLLIHRREIKKFASRAYEKGLTLIPLKLYFKEGRAKLLLGLCKGKQLHDKRQTMKDAQAKRDIARAMRRR